MDQLCSSVVVLNEINLTLRLSSEAIKRSGPVVTAPPPSQYITPRTSERADHPILL